MPAAGKWGRRQESYGPEVTHEWPITSLQQE